MYQKIETVSIFFPIKPWDSIGWLGMQNTPDCDSSMAWVGESAIYSGGPYRAFGLGRLKWGISRWGLKEPK